MTVGPVGPIPPSDPPLSSRSELASTRQRISNPLLYRRKSLLHRHLRTTPRNELHHRHPFDISPWSARAHLRRPSIVANVPIVTPVLAVGYVYAGCADTAANSDHNGRVRIRALTARGPLGIRRPGRCSPWSMILVDARPGRCSPWLMLALVDGRKK